MLIIQKELNEFADTWNLRTIRQSANTPGGKLDILFHVPETVDFEKTGVTINESDLHNANNLLGIEHHPVHRNRNMHKLLI